MSIPPFSASDFAVPAAPLSLDELRRLMPAEDETHYQREPRVFTHRATAEAHAKLRKLLEHDGNVVAGEEG